MVTTHLIVEGGGDTKAGKIELREGLSRFLRKAGVEKLPRIVRGGGRHQAYNQFVARLDEGCKVKLLVDSEGPVAAEHREDPWRHLNERDAWEKPDGATADHCHLMVQLVEAWFLADPDALEAYFGAGFARAKLGSVSDVEIIPKSDVYERLKKATARTKKRDYDKGQDTGALLGAIDPARVAAASYFAKRFLDSLR